MTPFARPLSRLVVQWPRLGPYHLARLRATHAAFAARGVDVVALETAEDDTTYEWRVEHADEPFDRVRAMPGAVYDATPAAPMRAAVRRALDRLDPDAVAINSYSLPDALASLEWCRRKRRVAVLVTPSTARDTARSPLKERLKRVLVAQYDAALTAGSRSQAYLRALGFPAERTFVTCDVVDNTFFRDGAERVRTAPARARALPGLGEGGPAFLCSARLVGRKNVDGLLSAYATYRQRAAAEGREPWRLIIVGDGPERAALEAAAPGGVTFAGFRQIDELPAYYALSDALVLPSHMDQWGLVVNEAMAAGLPVLVSTGCGCAPDLVEAGTNGYTFNPTHLGGLAEGLWSIATASPAARAAMGRRSSEIIEEGYSLDAFAEGMWRAVQAGRATADRALSPAARAALAALRLVPGGSRRFHAIRT